jgi:hypothetical protein
MTITSRLHRGLTALALASAAVAAQADAFTFSGQARHHNDVVRIDFRLSAASDVQLWTDSWQSGLNFDPLLAVFNPLTLIALNDDDDTVAGGQGYFDAGLALPQLAAGRYRLTLTAAPNAPIGTAWADGFAFDGQAPIAMAKWDQPSRDINANDQKGGYWQLHLNGVTQAAVVPEPTTLALLLAGLLAVIRITRRTRGR